MVLQLRLPSYAEWPPGPLPPALVLASISRLLTDSDFDQRFEARRNRPDL